MSETVRRVPAERLKELYRRFIIALGGSDSEASTFAERVVLADLRGMDWQGVKSLRRHYIYDIQEGNIRLGQEIEVLEDGPASIAFDAHDELGQVACEHMMHAIIAKAKDAGVAGASMRRSGDTGLLASYTLLGREADCICVMFNNTNPYVAPWGGAEAAHGIDPLSVAIPAGEEFPIVLDMSITEAQPAFNLVERMSPPFPKPPLMNFATVREYGLSVVVEAMSGALAGMPIGRDRVLRGESAVFALALHIPHFIDPDTFRANVDGYIRGVKASKRAEGIDEILLPGERGFREAELRARDGVPIPEEVWSTTIALAEDLGVDWRDALGEPSPA